MEYHNDINWKLDSIAETSGIQEPWVEEQVFHTQKPRKGEYILFANFKWEILGNIFKQWHRVLPFQKDEYDRRLSERNCKQICYYQICLRNHLCVQVSE